MPKYLEMESTVCLESEAILKSVKVEQDENQSIEKK